ncbi:MAG TPA: glycosyltransferase family 1 protein [Thermoleophilaceae bacterium]|nr:glycosyltransferase family 1 protein [Thermoleophilaceae bacterium]
MADLVVAQDLRVLRRPGPAGSGIGRYVECLHAALLERAGELGLRVEPINEPQRWEPLEHVLQARAVRRLGADVLHTPSLDFLSLRPGAPLVVTLHDLAPLKSPEVYLRTGLLHKLRYRAVRRARRVMVHSRAVATDGERLLGLDPERIVVVPSAVPPGFAPVDEPRARLSRLGVPAHFLLWVGSLDPIDPRKGVEPLVEAVAEGDGPPLVLAGAASPAAGDRLARAGRVLVLGRVSDSELQALYTAAEALVFPSEDEGFGFPPLEALACGTPVAAYAAGSLPEVLESVEGAVLVEPGDTNALLGAAVGLAGTRARAPARDWAQVAAEAAAVFRAAAG